METALYESSQIASAIICRSRHGEFRFLAFDADLMAAAGQVMAVFDGSNHA